MKNGQKKSKKSRKILKKSFFFLKYFYFIYFFNFLAEKKEEKRCYPLSFQIRRTQSYQSSPVHPVSESRGGPLSLTEDKGPRSTEILVSNIGYFNKSYNISSSYWSLQDGMGLRQTKHNLTCWDKNAVKTLVRQEMCVHIKKKEGKFLLGFHFAIKNIFCADYGKYCGDVSPHVLLF